MAPRFATVSKDEILAVNEAAATNNYQERDKIWLVRVYWSVEKIFLLNLQQIIKNDPGNTVN